MTANRSWTSFGQVSCGEGFHARGPAATETVAAGRTAGRPSSTGAGAGRSTGASVAAGGAATGADAAPVPGADRGRTARRTVPRNLRPSRSRTVKRRRSAPLNALRGR